MITFGLNTGQNDIVYGNREDTCLLCAREYAVENKTDVVRAERKIKGSFDGKKLFKVPLNGIRVTICMDHIHRLSEENRDAAD